MVQTNIITFDENAFEIDEDGIIGFLAGSALTAEVAGAANSGDSGTDDIIEANRTRIGEIEAVLIANGMLEAPEE